MEKEIPLKFKVLGMQIKMIVQLKLGMDVFEANVEAKICSEMLQVCFPNIEIFSDIQFSKTSPQRKYVTFRRYHHGNISVQK